MFADCVSLLDICVSQQDFLDSLQAIAVFFDGFRFSSQGFLISLQRIGVSKHGFGVPNLENGGALNGFCGDKQGIGASVFAARPVNIAFA